MTSKISVKRFVNAAAEGDEATIKNYIEAGGDVNALTKAGESAISFAILMKKWGVVDLLLEAGLEVDGIIDGYEKKTALHEAAFSGAVDVVRKLIDRGADVNRAVEGEDRDLRGRTPLIYSCFGFDGGDCVGTLKLLLEKGANVNGVDAKGQTALMHCVELVRTREASAMFGGSTGGSMSVADAFSMIGDIMKGSKEIAEGKAGRGDDESLEIIRLLVDAGADVNARDNVGNTAMIIASHHGLDRVVALLEELGAEPPRPGEQIQFDDEEEEDYDDDWGDDPAQWRGLATTDVNELCLLVRADIEQVTGAFSALKEAKEVQRDVQGKEVTLGEECYVVYQISGHPWTLVEILHGYDEQWQRPEITPEDALEISQKLGTPTIYFSISDTAYAVAYQLFDNGEVVEKFQFHENFDEEEDLDDDESDGMVRVFESRVRECTPEEYDDGMDFSGKFLKEQDAFVPGWSEGARTRGSKPGGTRVIDLRFGEDAGGMDRMDYVLVK